MKMKTRFISLCLILSFWSYAASAADAPPAPAVPQSVPAEVPAVIGPEVDPLVSPSGCPGECNPGPGWLGWWYDGLKPALQYSHWGYCDQFEEVPFGSSVRAHQQAQICSGWAARLWLYRYDFCDEGASLNPAGHRRLSELAGVFPVWSHHCLVIEATPGKPQLDAARRAHIAKLLEDDGIPAPVVIGVPRVSAPFGDETRDWNRLFIKRIQSGDSGLGGGSSGGASAGGGGGGGGQ
jgi:hypothetical protein